VPRSTRSSKKVILLCVVLGAVLPASPFLIRAFVVEAFQIPSGAMAPTLLVGDHVLCSKRVGEVRRGDVVVFRYPPDPSTDYVKRVVALSGDAIQVSAAGVVLNGEPIPRRLIGNQCPEGMEPGGACEQWEETIDGRTYEVVTQQGRAFGTVVVPAGNVFVMGDNRDNSSDSRIWGFLPIANIKARATVVWWSRGEHGVRWDRVNRPVR